MIEVRRLLAHGRALTLRRMRFVIVTATLWCIAVCACGSDYYDCRYDTNKVDPQCTAGCCSTVSTTTSGDPTYCLKTLAQGGHPGQTCALGGDRLTCTCN